MLDPFEQVPALLADPLRERGITQLTAVQLAVLSPETRGRDLRISSQTGSGKTVAFGFAVARALEEREAREEDAAKIPAAIIVTPTRELASQVASELTWLLAKADATVVSVTGGTSVRGEQRALKQGADVVVGTPGRLVDHLTSGALDATGIAVIVLDEADEMLDMGFREALETILGAAPSERRTHLVSATFPREVMALANRYQVAPLEVQGTKLGVANADITHVVLRVATGEREDVIVNLLALDPGASTLVFTRTREGTSTLARQLQSAGFSAAPLSGEMDQRERTRTLEAFRENRVRVLVATDVAARGIDLPAVTRIVHADPPEDADTYTHRSGRTARAGRKGESFLLISPAGLERAERLLRRAKVTASVWAVPTAQDVERAAETRLREELTRAIGEAPATEVRDELAAALIAEHGAERLVSELLARTLAPERARARPVTVIPPPTFRREARPERERSDRDRPDRPRPQPRAPRTSGPGRDGEFVRFLVTWGGRHGADVRRLLALACRRGGVQGSDIGAIDVGPAQSMIEVRAEQARSFAEAASRPDPRDPRVRITPFEEHGPAKRPSFEERAPAKRASFEERGTAKRPSFEERGAAKRPSFEERPPRRTAFEERGPTKRPNFEERAPAKRPSFEERGPTKRPSFEDRPPRRPPAAKPAAGEDRPSRRSPTPKPSGDRAPKRPTSDKRPPFEERGSAPKRAPSQGHATERTPPAKRGAFGKKPKFNSRKTR